MASIFKNIARQMTYQLTLWSRYFCLKTYGNHARFGIHASVNWYINLNENNNKMRLS